MPLAAGEIQLWLREFQLNGFIVLPNLLPLDFVQSLRARIMPFVEMQHEATLATQSQSGLRAEGRLSLDIAAYSAAAGGVLLDPRFRSHPLIEELVEAILGPQGAWGRGWTRIECAFPGCDYMSWHSDQTLDDTPDPSLPNLPRRLTFNIPLMEFTWANGAMEVVPGSHHLPRACHSSAYAEVPRLYPVSLRLRLGDAILRDGNMLHRGTPNLTTEPRAMLDQTYKLLTAQNS